MNMTTVSGFEDLIPVKEVSRFNSMRISVTEYVKVPKRLKRAAGGPWDMPSRAMKQQWYILTLP